MQTHAGQRICFYVLFPVLLWKVRGGPLTVPDGSPKPCRDCFSLARAMPVLTPSPRLSSQIRIAKLSTLSGRKAWKALNAKGNSKAARLDHGHWNLKPQAIDLGRSLWSRWFGCGWVLVDLAHQSTRDTFSQSGRVQTEKTAHGTDACLRLSMLNNGLSFMYG